MQRWNKLNWNWGKSTHNFFANTLDSQFTTSSATPDTDNEDLTIIFHMCEIHCRTCKKCNVATWTTDCLDCSGKSGWLNSHQARLPPLWSLYVGEFQSISTRFKGFLPVLWFPPPSSTLTQTSMSLIGITIKLITNHENVKKFLFAPSMDIKVYFGRSLKHPHP